MLLYPQVRLILKAEASVIMKDSSFPLNPECDKMPVQALLVKSED